MRIEPVMGVVAVSVLFAMTKVVTSEGIKNPRLAVVQRQLKSIAGHRRVDVGSIDTQERMDGRYLRGQVVVNRTSNRGIPRTTGDIMLPPPAAVHSTRTDRGIVVDYFVRVKGFFGS